MNELALCPCIKRNGSLCNSNLADNNFTHFIGCKSHGFHLKHHNVLEDSILGCCIDGLRSRIIRGQAGAYLNDDKRPRAKGNLRVNIPCTLDNLTRNTPSLPQGIKPMVLYCTMVIWMKLYSKSYVIDSVQTPIITRTLYKTAKKPSTNSLTTALIAI